MATALRPEMLFGIDTWVVGIVLLLALFAVPFFAYRTGLKLRKAGHAEDPQIGTIIGSVLGLLALLLGFTFSMSGSRFDNRKQLIVQEANAIGTTYLRADFLPEALRGPTKKLLAEYVENRIGLFDGGPNPVKDAADLREADRLQAELWKLAVAAGRAEPTSGPVKLYLESLNGALDLHDVRVSAMYNHVPQAILIVLVLAAAMGVGLVGYACGVHGRSSLNGPYAVSILTVFVILLIVELDRPRRGFIKIPPASLERLRDSMRTDS